MLSATAKLLLLHLRALRAKSGLTQEQLAEKAEISYKYYQAIEEGRKKDLRLSTLIKLAKAYDLSVSRLLETPSRLPAAGKPSQKVHYRLKKARAKMGERRKK